MKSRYPSKTPTRLLVRGHLLAPENPVGNNVSAQRRRRTLGRTARQRGPLLGPPRQRRDREFLEHSRLTTTERYLHEGRLDD